MYLYLIGAFDYNSELLAVKIGVSADIGRRIAAMQTGQFCEMRLIAAWDARSRAKAFSVESAMHEHYQRRRMRGEWFRPLIMRDAVHVVSDLVGAIPCEVPGVKSHLADVRDYFDRKRSRNRARRESRRGNRSQQAAQQPAF